MKETYLSRDFRETAAKFAVSVSQLKKSRIVLKQSCFSCHNRTKQNNTIRKSVFKY